MVFASSCCHCQVISQSLECWSDPTVLPPHLAPAEFVVIRQAGSLSAGFQAECCSSPGIHSCQHSPLLLVEVLSGERESPLAPSSPGSVAGEKLFSECSTTEDSVCARCESGHYQPSWTKEKHCAPHDICEDNAGLIVKVQGNATHNTVCQCQAGMHCSDISCQTCVENQPCQLGFGFVAAKAMDRMSSPCEPCTEGTFSNVSSKTEPCHPWTSCEEKGLVVKVKGTNSSDVICESSRRSSLSVLIPITAAVVTCLMGVCIYCLVHTDSRRRVPKEETLFRGQPVAQEDGKESRISEQEML
ncbi:tumor necrosis factor receptor superfamily member 5 isoform X2 [Parus major]|uniref:tumor necrosis factor receptor superfamily member 5 isoform X2 n=1 Tax=Parus major TaxID=9157 RepID=UPI00077134CF|nr:tumor necrosis factor receptor superfamily member 5 isoform X2 [Parus major]